MHRKHWGLVASAALAAAACHPAFQLKKFSSNESLYQASLREFQKKKWDNAVAGFEKLTTELPARDTLLPRSYWYLAQAHQRQDEWLLAAQNFTRLVESFPDDTLGDDAALEAARSYKHMWRKPTLDSQYGETALATYNTLLGLYPTSPLLPTVQKEVGDLNNWFAIKNYEAGMYYFRRKAYDSAVLYFRDVVARYPETPTVRDAELRLADSFKAIKYKDDLADVCSSLRAGFPGDHEVRETCGAGPAPAASSTPPPAKPPVGD